MSASTPAQRWIHRHRNDLIEVARTAIVTIAVVLLTFTALRLTFPDPPLAGATCPSALGEPAYGQCIQDWHASHAERTTHRTATGIAVVLIAATALFVIERPGLIRGVRLSLALAIGAGFAAVPAVVLVAGREAVGVAYLGATGLFVLASVIPADRGTRYQWLLAATIGVVAFVASLLVYFAAFYSWP